MERREILAVGDVREACEDQREVGCVGEPLGNQAQVLAILDEGHMLFAVALRGIREQRQELLAHGVAHGLHVRVEFLLAARAGRREDLLVGLVLADDLGDVIVVLEDSDRGIRDDVDGSAASQACSSDSVSICQPDLRQCSHSSPYGSGRP